MHPVDGAPDLQIPLVPSYTNLGRLKTGGIYASNYVQPKPKARNALQKKHLQNPYPKAQHSPKAFL